MAPRKTASKSYRLPPRVTRGHGREPGHRHRNPKLLELFVARRSWGVHHEVDGFRRFGEGDNFAQAAGPGADHHDTVEARSCEFVSRIRITRALRYLGGCGVSSCSKSTIAARVSRSWRRWSNLR